MERNYKNVYFIFWGVLIIAFIGFYKTYFSLFPNFEGLKTIHHFHAFMILSWIASLIIQPILIRKGQIKWHRIMGKVSYVQIPLLILSIILMVRNGQLREQNLQNLSFSFSDTTYFLLMYGLAIWNKSNTPFHIRYMVLTVLPFINPAFSRITQSFPPLLIGLAIIIGLLIFEKMKTKVYRPLVIGLISFLTIYISFALLPTTIWDSVWHLLF